MLEREAFLRAIRANPDDDTARLVFADWLDEHNDPLGTFIRVQLELHPVRDRVDIPRVKDLHQQEAALLKKHRKKWFGKALRVEADILGSYLVCERGLPERACLALDTLLVHGKALFEACPTLREIAVFDVQNRGRELANFPLFDRIDRLEIADWPTEQDASHLFTSPAILSRPVLRVWTGTNVGQCCLNWVPAGTALNRVELVQLPPGIDRAVKRFAARFRRAHERELSIVRPFDVTFALNSEGSLDTGRLPDGCPALLAVQYYGDWAVLVTFDEEGNKLQVRRWKRPAKAEKKEWAYERATLTPGLIRMKEFYLDEGIGVSFWAGRQWEYFDSPFDRIEYQDEEWWRGRGGRIRGWIERGDFVVTFGDSDDANRYTG
jgi:uncharacterized protein (TIGR02996 family)